MPFPIHPLPGCPPTSHQAPELTQGHCHHRPPQPPSLLHGCFLMAQAHKRLRPWALGAIPNCPVHPLKALTGPAGSFARPKATNSSKEVAKIKRRCGKARKSAPGDEALYSPRAHEEYGLYGANAMQRHQLPPGDTPGWGLPCCPLQEGLGAGGKPGMAQDTAEPCSHAAPTISTLPHHCCPNSALPVLRPQGPRASPPGCCISPLPRSF